MKIIGIVLTCFIGILGILYILAILFAYNYNRSMDVCYNSTICWVYAFEDVNDSLYDKIT